MYLILMCSSEKGVGVGGGDSHVKRVWMLVRKLELNPSLKEINLDVAQALFDL